MKKLLFLVLFLVGCLPAEEVTIPTRIPAVSTLPVVYVEPTSYADIEDLVFGVFGLNFGEGYHESYYGRGGELYADNKSGYYIEVYVRNPQKLNREEILTKVFDLYHGFYFNTTSVVNPQSLEILIIPENQENCRLTVGIGSYFKNVKFQNIGDLDNWLKELEDEYIINENGVASVDHYLFYADDFDDPGCEFDQWIYNTEISQTK